MVCNMAKKIFLNEKEVINFYKSGLSFRKVAKLYNVSDVVIRRILKSNKIVSRKRGEMIKGKNHYLYGKSPSEKTRQKLSKAGKKRKQSEETKKKQSFAHIGEKNPMYGRSGNKSPVFGRKNTKEQSKKQSNRMKKLVKENPEVFFNRLGIKFSKGHKRIENLLRLNNINFIHEYKIERYSIDIFLIDYNICLEIDGEYWHKRDDTIKKDIKRDNYLRRKGYKIIRLWHDKEAMTISFKKLMDKLLEELK